MTGYFPMRQSATQTDLVQKQMDSLPVYKKAFTFLPYAKGEPNIAGWQGVRDAMQNAETAVITGKATPQQALADAQKAAQDAINQTQ